MDSNHGGAVAYAAKPGFHPSDGPSGRITQNEEAIYSVVVVFYKGIPQTETSPSTAQRAPAYIHGMGRLNRLPQTAGAFALRVVVISAFRRRI